MPRTVGLDEAIWKETNREVPVPVGKWMTVEYSFKEGDAKTGRFSRAITPEGGRREVVLDITPTPGCVAFWDFVKRESDGAHRFTVPVPPGATNDFALDAGRCGRTDPAPLPTGRRCANATP